MLKISIYKFNVLIINYLNVLACHVLYTCQTKLFNNLNSIKMSTTQNNQNLVNEISMRFDHQHVPVFNSPKGCVWNARRRFK